MSTNDQVNLRFSEFGKMLFIVGILYIIDIIFSIIGYIGAFIGIAIFILMIIGLNNIKQASISLNSPLLREFHSRLLASLIIFLIGGFFIDIRSVIVFGVLIDVVSFILAYSAWSKFLIFAQNTNFGPSINETILKRTGNLKTANLLLFLIITAIIGIVFLIVGYIGLGAALKTLNFQTQSSPNQQYQGFPTQSYSPNPSMSYNNPPSPSPNPSMSYNNNTSPATADTITKTVLTPKFCSICGANLKENAKFCTKCGSPVPKSNP